MHDTLDDTRIRPPGIEPWRDVEAKRVEDGRGHFKGTAYFSNIADTKLTHGPKVQTTWEQTDSGGRRLITSDGPNITDMPYEPGDDLDTTAAQKVTLLDAQGQSIGQGMNGSGKDYTHISFSVIGRSVPKGAKLVIEANENARYVEVPFEIKAVPLSNGQDPNDQASPLASPAG